MLDVRIGPAEKARSSMLFCCYGSSPQRTNLVDPLRDENQLTPEAAVVIIVNHFQKILNAPNSCLRFIDMPFEVRSFPENLPAIPCLDVRGLGNRLLHDLALVSPVGSNFEDLDALAPYTEPDV